MTRKKPHVPRPREGVLPNGDLAVVRDRQLRDDSVTVPEADRPLYELLMEVLWDCHVPDTMPANLAVECDDLVDVRDLVSNPERGTVSVNGVGYGLGYSQAARRAIEDHRDREPLRLIGVGCSGSKHEVDEPVPAKNLYRGSYWSCKDDYSATFGDDRRIISAEHGVLRPDEPIPYYECTPSDLRGIPIDSDRRLPSGDDVDTLLDRWALLVHDALAAWIDDAANGVDPRDVELEILLGRKYRTPLEDRDVFSALRARGDLAISFPFQEVEQAQGGNGNQMGWMSDEVEAAVATDGGQPTTRN